METTTRRDIFAFVKKRFNTVPEYLWQRFPDCAVLRSNYKNKWYAVLMEVERCKLGLKGDGLVDVICVKCPPLLIDLLKNEKGILPAYHMNKGHWVSITLDGTAERTRIFDLITLSKNTVEDDKKKGTK